VSFSKDVRKFFDFAAPFYNLFTAVIFAKQRKNYKRIGISMMNLSGNIICLDVGTGTGEGAEAFVEVCREAFVVGIDVSKK